MNAKDKRIIELETEVRMLREQLDFERSKPPEVKYIPSTTWPNTAGWGRAGFPGPIKNEFPNYNNMGSISANQCGNTVSKISGN